MHRGRINHRKHRITCLNFIIDVCVKQTENKTADYHDKCNEIKIDYFPLHSFPSHFMSIYIRNRMILKYGNVVLLFVRCLEGLIKSSL